MFDLKEYIKLCCVKRNDISTAELARLSEISIQNLCNKYAKNKFSNHDLEKIAAALDSHLEIKFIDNATGQPII